MIKANIGQFCGTVDILWRLDLVIPRANLVLVVYRVCVYSSLMSNGEFRRCETSVRLKLVSNVAKSVL